MRPVVALLLIPWTVAGCTKDPWEEHPIAVAPDHSCRTGGDGGFDVFQWDCLEGRRVVVLQWCSALLGCRTAERQTAPCGELTLFERQNRPEYPVGCSPPPRAWQPPPP